MNSEDEIEIDKEYLSNKPDSPEPDDDALQSAYLGQKRGEDKSIETIRGYKYSFKRLNRFIYDYDLSYSEIDRGTNLSVDIDHLEGRANTLNSNNILDYFVMWLLHDEGYPSSTTNTTYKFVQPFLDFLHAEGYIEYDAVKHFSLGSYINYGETQQSKHFGDDYVALSYDQYRTVRENVQPPIFRNRLILDLAWTTGMRRKEIACLTLDDVDWKTGRIDVPDVKGGERPLWVSDRSLKTNLQLWEEAKRQGYYNTDSDWFFLTDDQQQAEGAGISPARLSQMFRRAAEHLEDQDSYETQAGYEKYKYSFHSLRHGFAEYFIQQSGDNSIYTLKELLSHESVSTTEQYLQSDKDEFLRGQMKEYAPSI